MKNIPQEALRQFLIGISKKHLDSNTSYEDAFYYIYQRPNGTRDIYERIVRLAFTTLARNKYDQPFTVGKAQKWINMSIKHLALFSSELTDSYYEFAHIPVDSYIISGLKDKLDCTFGQDPNRYISWNNIDDYDLYLKFQKDFREYCGEAPLDAEFHLWMKERGL